VSADPRLVGALLLSRELGSLEMREDPTLPLHHFADLIEWEKMPPYDASESLVSETHRRYHDELQERARNGDKYARSMLLGQAYQDG